MTSNAAVGFEKGFSAALDCHVFPIAGLYWVIVIREDIVG